MAIKKGCNCPFTMLKLAFTNHKGTGHKAAHNLTTIANIPLVAWFVYAVLSLRGADYEALQAFLGQPFNMVMAILFVIVPLTHFALEIEVVYEDYISDLKKRALMINLMKVVFGLIGLATIVSILKLGL
tara:strand:- start:1152 stop:1538 length:387 start_codon:yes stop_codon:yes gene_type:complete